MTFLVAFEKEARIRVILSIVGHLSKFDIFPKIVIWFELGYFICDHSETDRCSHEVRYHFSMRRRDKTGSTSVDSLARLTVSYHAQTHI